MKTETVPVVIGILGLKERTGEIYRQHQDSQDPVDSPPGNSPLTMEGIKSNLRA